MVDRSESTSKSDMLAAIDGLKTASSEFNATVNEKMKARKTGWFRFGLHLRDGIPDDFQLQIDQHDKPKMS